MGKIGLITPTRNDRPLFKEQYNKIIKSQTLQPDEIIMVDYEPVSKDKDLGARYRIGIKEAEKRGCDVALLWEDDDWYHPTYLEWIFQSWKDNNKPDVFGVDITYYWNINEEKGRIINHPGRSSAFCTLLKLPYKYSFIADDNIWFDLHLYKDHAKKYLTTKTIPFPEESILAIGIKHGTGITGGGGHNNSMYNRVNGIKHFNWFKTNCLDSKIYKDIALKIKNENK